MALHYRVKEKDCLLSTNYKVWFSTLEKQANLEKIPEELVLLNYFSRANSATSHSSHFLLTRNPYHRLESFFKDKFRKNPLMTIAGETHTWQYCQRIFFPFLKAHEEDSVASIREKLLLFPFEDFMQCLPEVWHLDHHLVPQYEAHYFTRQEHEIKIHFDHYLKVESAKVRLFLTDELQLDLRLVRNSTKDVDIAINWTNAAKSIAEKIYRDDFTCFEYPFRE